MQLKKLALSIATLAALGACGTAGAYTNHEEQIIVHPFQWTYDMIADECEEVLGPNGFDGVQISQPAEHIDRRDVWWAAYQPVNFNKFTTMTGNEKQLRNMIKRCNGAGVKVYADAVFNHRAYDGHKGLGGSYYDARSFNYPDLDRSDFNDYNCSPNYGDQWSIWHCALSGMPDLNVENEATQQKVANYLKNLMSMGVYGFRVDSAKHMPPEAISGILAKAGNPLSYLDVRGSAGEAVLAGDYTNIPNTVVTEYSYGSAMKSNIINPKGLVDMKDGWFNVNSDGAETFIVNFDEERATGSGLINYKLSPRYSLSQSFLVAWPYGKIRQVYSGYKFDQHDPAGPFGDARCTGGWNCEHRVSTVMNAVGFARATRGYGVSYKGASDDGKVIWFTRGDKGFYVMNSGDQPITWTFDTHMPDGQYCEILQQAGKCDGQQIIVKNGKAEITVYDKSAAAICTDDSGQGFCGSKCKGDQCPVPPQKQLYIAGNFNYWKHVPMTLKDGMWTFDFPYICNRELKFKITDAPDWFHNIWGAGSNNLLCNNEVECPDIVVNNICGNYSILVSSSELYWKFYQTDDNHVPVAEFSSSVKGLTVDFSNNSTDEDNDELESIWDFGDGTGSYESDPSHTYSAAGTYNVTLKVSDHRAEPVSKTMQINVFNPGCRPTVDSLYYSGTTNGWTHDEMKFNPQTCKWTIDLNLTGNGDSNGVQRFKVTNSPDWKGKVYGNAGNNKLCDDQSKCGDVKIPEVGGYTLSVDDISLTWSLQRTTYIPATHDAMYFAGTPNHWIHDPMIYDPSTGYWWIEVTWNGEGDENGPDRFKITSSPDWHGTVWGDAGYGHLCSDQSRCPDIPVSDHRGDRILMVNDRNLTWEFMRNLTAEPDVQ